MMDFFGCPNDSVFQVSEVLLHCIQNLFEKLGKSEMKNLDLHFNLSNPKKRLSKG